MMSVDNISPVGNNSPVEKETSVDPIIMSKQDIKFATLAQLLYLTNITIFPVFSFVILILIYFKNRARLNPTTLLHFRQSLLANMVAGFLLIGVSALILLMGSWNSPYTWMYFLIYVLSIHSGLILFGVFAMIKANAGQAYIYPVFGRFWSS